MNWLNLIAFAVLLLSVLCDGRKHSSSASKSPWEDAAKAKAFTSCLIKKIEKSNVFPQQEKEDMEMLVQSMTTALSGESKGSNSAATKQAMNMAFASAMAELVVAEDADDPESIAIKTEALSKALKQCFKETMHKVNRKFIAEIKDLIQMFVKEAAEEKDEGEEEGDYPSNLDSDIDINLTINQPQNYDQNQGYPGEQPYPADDQRGPSDRSPGSGAAPDQVLSGLSRSKMMTQIFGQMRSPAQKKALIQKLMLKIGQKLGLDPRSSNDLANSAGSVFLSLSPSSSPSDYMNALSVQLKPKLLSSGFLDRPDGGSLMVKLFLNQAADEARRMGINIPRDTIDSDIRDISSSVTTTTTTTSVQTSLDMGSPGEQPYPADDQWGPSGMPSETSPGSGAAPDQVLSGLSRSRMMAQILGKMRSPAQKKALIQKLLLSVGPKMGLDPRSSNDLANSAGSVFLSLSPSSSPSDYMNALSVQLKPKLLSSGFLDRPDGGSLMVKLFLNQAADEARRMGINIPRDTIDSDIRDISSSVTTTTIVQTSVNTLGGLSLNDGDLGLSASVDSPVLGDDLISPGVDARVSVNALLNSPNGLKSPEATLRVNNLSSALKMAFGDNGIDANVLSGSLQASFEQLKKSGMSADKAAMESLMEFTTALMNLLGSSRLDPMKSLGSEASIELSTNVLGGLIS